MPEHNKTVHINDNLKVRSETQYGTGNLLREKVSSEVFSRLKCLTELMNEALRTIRVKISATLTLIDKYGFSHPGHCNTWKRMS